MDLNYSYIDNPFTSFTSFQGLIQLKYSCISVATSQKALLNSFSPYFLISVLYNILWLSVRPSVCLSAENLTCELSIFLLLPYNSSYNAHIWYEGTSHQNASAGTKVTVICQGQGRISRLHFSKNGRFGGIRFHKHMLFVTVILSLFHKVLWSDPW